MTLKEKIRKLNLSTWISSGDTKKLEKTAEDFAIGFAEWSDDNYFRMGNTSMWTASLDYEDGIVYKTKELLEIYKKEKGL